MTERLLPAISACVDWAREAEPPPVLEVDDLALLLGVHHDSGAHDPGDWTVDDVHEVAALLREGGELPESLRETWLAWCDHLVLSGRLQSAESPRRLRAAVERVDLSPGSPVQSGPDPLAAAAGPLLDRLGYQEDQEPVPLPAYVPAPMSELDARAGACPTLHWAARLAAWVEPNRLLCPESDHDALCEEDTARAAEALDTAPEEVSFLFTVARSAGLVRTTYLHAMPGPAAHAWAWELPGAAADAWADGLAAMAALPGPVPFLVLAELFLSGQARTPEELVRACGPGAVPEVSEEHVRRALEVLVSLDAVEEIDQGSYRASGLGDHYVARRLRAAGVDVPVAQPVPWLSD
ncbi:hypothetical protein [Nocardiopsis valliformis]|uniref:hypothetical protein n=1 Tax=Nocardiopsis valliformis TaxID=239974 RepID=UPI00036D484A|nr:hypothetical protein [Nocardiopsis valliformis]